MKRIILILIASCFYSICIAQSPEHGPMIEFDAREYDFGVIDKGCSVTHEFVYTNIGDADLIIEKVFPNRYISVVEYTKTAVKPGMKGKVVLSFKSENIGDFSTLLTVKTNAVNVFRSMLCMKGTVIDQTEPREKNGKWGLETNGKTYIPFVYESLQRISESTFIAKQNGKYGVVNSNNNRIIPIEYDKISDYWHKDKYCKIEKNNKFGVIDNHGNIILQTQYDYVDFDDYIIAEKNKKYGCVDLNGQIIVPFEYENLSYCGGDYFVAKKNKYGLITKENKIVYDFKTDEIWFAAKEDVFAYRMNTTWYVVKREGNCTVCIIDCSSEDKAKGAGGVVILKAISEGLNKVDCDIIDEAFLLLHYYEYKW